MTDLNDAIAAYAAATSQLRPRQLLFVEHALSGKSARAAMRASGYRSPTNASRLTHHPKVSAAIAAGRILRSCEADLAAALFVQAGALQAGLAALSALHGPRAGA
jgi:hypothetical protein